MIPPLKVSAIRARGGTSFSAVLTAMREHACSCRPDASHLVVLFTDGQDCCGGVEEALGALKAAMADRRTDWQVHCLGFGPYHDATFLASLTLAGSEAGSFQYVQDASAQEGLLGALDGVLEVRTLGFEQRQGASPGDAEGTAAVVSSWLAAADGTQQ